MMHDPKRRQLITGATRLRPWKQVIRIKVRRCKLKR